MTPFETTFSIRFGEVDQAGITYYPNIYHYCHVVMEEYFDKHVGEHYQRIVDDRHLGFPTVAIETSFDSPFRYGIEVRATVAIERVGTKSTVWRFEFFDAESGVRLASSRHTTVAVDMRTFEPRAVPDDLRRVFTDA